ncbi:hypothetical protein TNCV_972961 [Trichonephila clavipes]|nr:hypothetical protein TNCV_972961 [Trichonephila clavipes]
MVCRKGLSPDENDNLLGEISDNEKDGVSPDVYIARDGTEWIPHNSNVPGRFVARNNLRQCSGPTSFVEHNINVSFL